MTGEAKIYFHDARKLGTRIGNVVLGEAIGQGGEGIVYKAKHSSFGTVVVKEYLPKAIASRDSKGQVREANDNFKQCFQKGRKKFEDDGERLCQLDPHQNVVQFLELIKSDKTAFLVMRWVDGDSLKKLFGAGAFEGPEKIERLADELASALTHLHDEDLLHLDVAPDNIIINRRTGKAVLIDFNAARNILTEATQSTEAFVKAGYSPIEQYSADAVNLKPASDIYAVSAVLYRAITGHVPISAADRSSGQSLPLLDEQSYAGYRPAFLAAINAGLARTVNKRPQSAREWRAMMSANNVAQDKRHRSARLAWPKISGTKIAIGAALLLIGGAALVSWNNDPDRPAPIATKIVGKVVKSPPVVSQSQIALLAKADVKILVYDADNKSLFDGVLKNGERYAVPDGPSRPSIQTDQPDQLMVVIDGKEDGFLAPFPVKLKDIILSKDAIAATQQSLAATAKARQAEAKTDDAPLPLPGDEDSMEAAVDAATAAAAAVDAAAEYTFQIPAVDAEEGEKIFFYPAQCLRIRSKPTAKKGQSEILGLASPGEQYLGELVVNDNGDYWIKLDEGQYVYNGYINGLPSVQEGKSGGKLCKY